MQIISYKSAKALGLKRYFTGKPCKRGHIAERFTINCACCACTTQRTNKWLEDSDNQEIKRQLTREWVENKKSGVTKPKGEWSGGYGSEGQKKYRKENADLYNRSSRNWYSENKAYVIENVNKWRNENRELVRTHVRNRKARKLASDGSHTAQEIEQLLTRQKWKCANCGTSIKKERHIDHKKPLAKGGANDIGNLQGLCPGCNMRKHDKDEFEWARMNGRLL